jgi:multidrug efflux pump subunit AcrB
MIMAIQGAVAPVVYGGKVRAVLVYLDREKLQARGLSPLDVMEAVDNYNLFLPTGDAKFGDTDYALDSNSMYQIVERMGNIPLRPRHGNSAFVKDVGTPSDTAFIQTNIVRVDGRKQVYIPVFRQLGASTLKVVHQLKHDIQEFQNRITRPGIQLKVVMDQSIYVEKSIHALVQEGLLGAVLCSTVILLFLGQIRMTAIAIMTLPLACLTAVAGLYFIGQTINVMTLAGLTLAIGPMVDSAIICLENTERHLHMGADPHEAAFLGASEVAMPELVSTLCTFLVLAPLAMTPGLGKFLFQPMMYAVAFAMTAAYILSRTLVPACSAYWLKPVASHGSNSGGHGHGEAAPGPGQAKGHEAALLPVHGNGNGPPRGNAFQRAFGHWSAVIDAGIAYYVKGLDWVLAHRVLTILVAYGLFAATIVVFWPIMRKEFFPEVDAGAFEMYVRAPSGTRIEVTEERVKAVEEFLRKTIKKDDLELFISEIGVVADWSAAYTPNSGPMDALIKVQLTPERSATAQEYVESIRKGLLADSSFADLEFSFDAGGMVRGAMNEGKSTPINIRVTGKNQERAHRIASLIKDRVVQVEGVVDARIIQRLNYPEYMITIDQAKAADLQLTQSDVMRNVVAAFNSSIQFNKHNFWIDPKSHNQYFVGVQYLEEDIKSVETLLDIPLTSPKQKTPIPLRNVATITRTNVPTEVKHYNIQPTIELTMGVSGRDLGHVSDDVAAILETFGKPREEPGQWDPYDPDSLAKNPKNPKTLPGSKIVLSGEYSRMKDTFNALFGGLALSFVLMYFLMVGLDKSFLVPFSVLSVVPLSLIGILPMLYFTKTAINVQSLLGFIFIVGIKVANTVLMSDYAQELRRHEGLTPTQAIRKAASVRVRPVTMTALAALFAMIPGAMALERGSEANAPLARAIIGGLAAGEPATLFILPAIYSLIIRDPKGFDPARAARHEQRVETETDPNPDAGWV